MQHLKAIIGTVPGCVKRATGGLDGWRGPKTGRYVRAIT
jgi:hypothetical protein